MITEFEYNDRVTIGYEHMPIYASANVITGTKYRTKIYLINPNNTKYPLGEIDGKLDEEQVRFSFEDIIKGNQEAHYAQQSTFLRRSLKPIRERSRGYGNSRATFTRGSTQTANILRSS